jgi:hypothetical protein
MANYYAKASLQMWEHQLDVYNIHLDIYNQQIEEINEHNNTIQTQYQKYYDDWVVQHAAWEQQYSAWQQDQKLKSGELPPEPPFEPPAPQEPVFAPYPEEPKPPDPGIFTIYESREITEPETLSTSAGDALILPGRIILTGSDGVSFSVSDQELEIFYVLETQATTTFNARE